MVHAIHSTTTILLCAEDECYLLEVDLLARMCECADALRQEGQYNKYYVDERLTGLCEISTIIPHDRSMLFFIRKHVL